MCTKERSHTVPHKCVDIQYLGSHGPLCFQLLLQLFDASLMRDIEMDEGAYLKKPKQENLICFQYHRPEHWTNKMQ